MTAISYPLVERTLANGLRVIVSEDHTAPNVAVNLWVGVGSRHESPGRTGFAHLFEHLMFQGSRNVQSGEHFSALMDEGARLNATTWFDRTNYFETVPTGALELALWLEADRHGHLLDAVTQENLDNQRDVVKEEKRQRYDNVPYGTALIDIYAAAFPEDHPYHHPTIGSMEDLDAATLEDVHAFFRSHYGPNNTVLTLVGDIDPEEGFASGGEVLRPLPAIELAARRATSAAAAHRWAGCGSTASATCPTTASTSPSACPWTRRPTTSPARWPSTCWVVCEQSGSCVGSCAPTRPRWPSAAGPWASSTAWASAPSPSTSSAGADADEVEQALCEEIERFIAEGPDEAELESVIADTERSWLSALASIEERADHISHHALLTGDPDYVNTFVDRLRAVERRATRGPPPPRGSTPARGPWCATSPTRVAARAGGGGMTAVSASGRRAAGEPWDFPAADTHDLPNGLTAAHLRRAGPVRPLAPPRTARSRCATSRATGRVSRRSWRARSTRAPSTPRRRSSPGCSSARASASGPVWPTPGFARPRRRQGQPRAGPRPAAPDPHRAGLPADRGRPSGAHPSRRDRPGESGARGPRRAGVRPHVLRTRRPLVAAHRRIAGDGRADHPRRRGGVPRASTSSRPA